MYYKIKESEAGYMLSGNDPFLFDERLGNSEIYSFGAYYCIIPYEQISKVPSKYVYFSIFPLMIGIASICVFVKENRKPIMNNNKIQPKGT